MQYVAILAAAAAAYVLGCLKATGITREQVDGDAGKSFGLFTSGAAI